MTATADPMRLNTSYVSMNGHHKAIKSDLQAPQRSAPSKEPQTAPHGNLSIQLRAAPAMRGEVCHCVCLLHPVSSVLL